MVYFVEVAARAERDLASLYDQINAGSSDTARKWYRGHRVIYRILEKRKQVVVIHIRHGARREF
jgi:plasmid stabilization system protein ParE